MRKRRRWHTKRRCRHLASSLIQKGRCRQEEAYSRFLAVFVPLLAREVAFGLQLWFPGATAAAAEHTQTTDCVSANSDVRWSLGASAGAAHKGVETLDRPTRMLAHDAEHAVDQLLRGLSDDFINLVDWCDPSWGDPMHPMPHCDLMA
jgi:hypothetical protein